MYMADDVIKSKQFFASPQEEKEACKIGPDVRTYCWERKVHLRRWMLILWESEQRMDWHAF
jgi:hypothetical protein